MTRNIYARPFDLITPDGVIRSLRRISDTEASAVVEIENISSQFKGFEINHEDIDFNIKSTFAQLGVDAFKEEIKLHTKLLKAEIKITLRSFNDVGKAVLANFTDGVFIGKLFAADPRRRVRTADYLTRLFGKSDDEGNPLLVLSTKYKSEQIIEQPDLERTIVKVPLEPGYWEYDEHVIGFIPTIVKGLTQKKTSFRKFLNLHQVHIEGPRHIPQNGYLLVRTMMMNIRTLFARVANDELPSGFLHAAANILEPQLASVDIFEFHGSSDEEIHNIPLEFYTLEPHRENFYYLDRDLLKESLEKPENLFRAFDTVPSDFKAATFVVKGHQFLKLTEQDWILGNIAFDENLIVPPSTRKERATLNKFIEGQCCYPILKSMQEGYITSQGVILSKYLPTPLLKRFLLNEKVSRCVKAIYFETPSEAHGDYFSAEDRNMLNDLAKAEIDIFWVDRTSTLLLQYVLRADKDCGIFVPLDRVEEFKISTLFGVYGSRLEETIWSGELKELFKGLLEMRAEVDHVHLNPEASIALTTGGGPGVMLIGNRIASEVGILSIGLAVDFRKPHEQMSTIETLNPFVQGKMTYRLENLIVRQDEFFLDYPIFFQGGYGTDFELALEILRTQVGTKDPNPILLFGNPEYWQAKITHTFEKNRETGTIRGSEWVSNTFFCVQNYKQALDIYYMHFTNRLKNTGPNASYAEGGFVVVKN